MIMITKLAASLLIQKDGAEICIDDQAVARALPAVLACLIDNGRALGQARREGYEAGLTQGYEQCRVEQATSERIAERQAADLVDALVGLNMANAA